MKKSFIVLLRKSGKIIIKVGAINPIPKYKKLCKFFVL
jgi:hypothetical protein